MGARLVVVGATGTVGTEVVKLLRQRGVDVRATTRNVAAASRRDGVQWVRSPEPGSADPSMLVGAAGLFLMAPSGLDDQWAMLSPWITAAAREKVPRVVLMTAQEVDDADRSPFRRAELELIDSGISHVIIRPNWFMQNFHNYWGDEIRRSGIIALPAGDGKVGFIDARDVAAVAASQLVDDNTRSGTFVLTGPEAFNHRQAARILSDATGRRISYRNVHPDEFARDLSVGGMPGSYVRLVVEMFAAVRAGSAAGLTNNVKLLAGLPARSLANYAHDFRERLI